MMRAGAGTSDTRAVLGAVQEIAAGFSESRHDRQRRRHLDRQDFDMLKAAGFLRTGVPRKYGGMFESVETSTRPICDILRALAHGDASVALVATMHPAVTFSGNWLAEDHAPEPHTKAWEDQRQFVFQTALELWWGTITSEPGSGGAIMNTKATASPGPDGRYLLSGQKHFGSGSGITSYMITTAVPEGEDAPDMFFLDMRDVPWDGSRGVELVAEWDGHGMTATQSHGMLFRDYPATRSTYPGMFTREFTANIGFVPCIFTAVIVGITQVAMATARERLQAKRDALSPFEQVEWTKAQQEAWLIEQAFEGMLRSTELEYGRNALRGKTAIAELAESLMTRLCRVMGGGSYARHSPFGFWHQDVRALGFLRPPWALAYQTQHEESWDEG